MPIQTKPLARKWRDVLTIHPAAELFPRMTPDELRALGDDIKKNGLHVPVTSMYDVPLMVARGYASLSFLYSAADAINELVVPAYIYHLGDFDPSGVNAGEKIEETLRELAPDAEIYFERIAVTKEQIAEWSLPTRPTKSSDTRSKNFGSAISVELDAIDPNALRSLVQETIEQHLPADQFEVLKAAEQSEREIISRLVRRSLQT